MSDIEESPKNSADEEIVEEPEVIHKESTTPLFSAIEEMEWTEALGIVTEDPVQVRTWVRSQGSENTTFDWSVWRRLPIHEACRRQAPAWLVSELLSKFPESAYKTTHLGELPLHLAVDKACAPEVVNLIIVANWNAIITQDQAGRTPLDIIDRSELLQFEDYRIVFESLTRCHKAFMDVQKASMEEQAALKRKQKATFSAVSRRHQDELRSEHEKQAKLRNSLEDLKQEIENMKEDSKSKDHQIKKHELEKDRWMETIRDLKEQVEGLNRDLVSERRQNKVLLAKIEHKEQEISDKETKISILSNDLKNIAASNRAEVMDCLNETEQSMRTMVSKQIELQKLLTLKAKDLKRLLIERGIPEPEDKRTPVIQVQEEKKVEEEPIMESEEASAAMMAAAVAALQRP
mmetsp:Transcript_29682/g.55637  ORF Transcript_29682/g.55637 Transcript_29682/m.55637 type:complete len:405 (+) Transcript_29682:136-1350(+)